MKPRSLSSGSWRSVITTSVEHFGASPHVSVEKQWTGRPVTSPALSTPRSTPRISASQPVLANARTSTPAKAYDEFYQRILEEGTIFVRGKAAEITDAALYPGEEGKLVVQVEDTLAGFVRRSRL